jgi:hypothetical protein
MDRMIAGARAKQKAAKSRAQKRAAGGAVFESNLADDYATFVNKVRNVVDCHQTGTNPFLESAATEWVQDQYNGPKYQGLVQELKTAASASGTGTLAGELWSLLLTSEGSPKLRFENGCWTYLMNDSQHKRAVACFDNAKTMATNVGYCLSGYVSQDNIALAKSLFQQYFGQPAAPDRDKVGTEVATESVLVQRMVSCGQG